ncbi:MAG: hypothetical protein JST48_03365 [Bacteroidetes bacterium]|nr:hypothetical protein [Bacteroidota bacterium]
MNTDDILQTQIEKGNVIQGIDADAYKIVFNALKQEPDFKLSDGFVMRVTSTVDEKKSFDWDKLLIAVGAFGFVVVLAYALTAIKPTFTVGIFTFILSYQGLIGFGIVFILMLNWIDQRLISRSK